MSGCFAYYLLDLLVLSPHLPFFSFVYLNFIAPNFSSLFLNVSQDSGQLHMSHITQHSSIPVILRTTAKSGDAFKEANITMNDSCSVM